MSLLQEGNRPKELPFSGKNFVITGAASGIGRALAIEAANAGANVVGIDRVDRPFSHEVQAGKLDPSALPHIDMRVNDVTSPHWLPAATRDMQGNIDYVIIAAGITQSKPGQVDE